MSAGGEIGVRGRLEKRPVVYCLVPSELAERLHDPLRRHFADEPGVEVIVERRGDERRGGANRRQAEAEPPAGEERRQASGAGGRRIGERRAALAPVADPPELPRRVRRYAERIVFVERLEPTDQAAEDLDTARVVARFQAGDREAFATLYTRYFDRVYAYLRAALRDRHEAEDLTQQVFTQVFESLPAYERRGQPFRAWLFRVVRNLTIDRLRRVERVELHPTEDVQRWQEEGEGADTATEALERVDWLTDRDVTIFVERLPLPQRQVLFLTFMLDLPSSQVAKILGRTDDDIRLLRSRALRHLRSRLEAIGRKAPKEGGRPAPAWSRIRQQKVLRARRFVLR